MSLILTPDKIKEHLHDSSKKLAELTCEMTVDNHLILKPLLEVSFEDKNPFSQRASHVIAILACRCPELIKPVIPSIINEVGKMKTDGVKRNFLKIISEYPFKLTGKEESKLLNLCFDYLNQDNSIAVKVYSLDILYNLTLKYPELQSELYNTIESVIIDAGPGLKSRGIKTMKKIAQKP